MTHSHRYITYPILSSFSLPRSLLLCHPRSFPTRRSSDLSFRTSAGARFPRSGLALTFRTPHTAFRTRGGQGRDEKPHPLPLVQQDRKSTRLNSSHLVISYAVFCLKKKKNIIHYI